MTTDTHQLSQVQDMVAAEPHEAHAEHIHLPGPSIWPVALAVGVMLVMLGLVTHLAVSSAGVLVAVGAAAGWISETRKQSIELEGREGPPRFVHTVLFQYMAQDETAVNAAGGLRSQVDQHLLAIKGMRGLEDQLLLRTNNYEGPIQMIVTTTWKDVDRLADYEEAGATVEALIKASDAVVAGSVQVYDLQEA